MAGATGQQVDSKQPSKTSGGAWTSAELERKALEKAERRQRIRQAVAYAKAKPCGAKAALKWAKEQGWTDLTHPVIHNGLKGTLKWLHERCEYEILTDIEGQRLEEWLIASAKNDCAAKEQAAAQWREGGEREGRAAPQGALGGQ